MPGARGSDLGLVCGHWPGLSTEVWSDQGAVYFCRRSVPGANCSGRCLAWPEDSGLVLGRVGDLTAVSKGCLVQGYREVPVLAWPGLVEQPGLRWGQEVNFKD